jgi:hypothetical protein
MEERRQSHAVNNAKTGKFASPLAVLKGFSRGAELPEPIVEDTESKHIEDEPMIPSELPLPKTTNSYPVGGRVVRLSKAATTGRISAPLIQDFQPGLKKFDRPKIIPDLSPTETKPPTEHFTVLAEAVSPRETPIIAPSVEDSVNPYQSITNSDSQPDAIDGSPNLDSSQGLLFQTRNRSLSDDLQIRKNSVAPAVRNSVIKLSSKPESDIVSGFEETISVASSSHVPPNVHLPPITHPPTSKWNVADMEEEGSQSESSIR